LIGFVYGLVGALSCLARYCSRLAPYSRNTAIKNKKLRNVN